MTLSRPQARAPRRRGPLIVAVGLLPALTACAGAATQVQLPAKPAVKRAAVLTPPVLTPAVLAPAVLPPKVLTPRQQVVAALTGYTAALSQADKSRNKSAARELLRPYLAASRIGGLVQAMITIWSRGESFYGADIVHVSSVRIDGLRAFVHDCDDTSRMGLIDAMTGEIVPGSGGVRRDNLVTRLDLVGGHWLVQYQLVEDVRCTP
jgi:hypothetical protein